MIPLSIEVQLDINVLSEKYLPFVEWSQIPVQDIQRLDTHKLKYCTMFKLQDAFLNQEQANMTDEDVLSMISRDINKLRVKYDYTRETRIVKFIHNFTSPLFIEKYHKQIISMVKMANNNDIARIPALFMTYGYDTENLVGKNLYVVSWDIINSTNISIEQRFKIMKSGSYLAYVCEYDLELIEMVPLLYTEQLKQTLVPAPDIFDDYALSFMGRSFYPELKDRTSITWNELIDLYYKGELQKHILERAWDYFITNYDDEASAIEARISSKLSNHSIFHEADFV